MSEANQKARIEYLQSLVVEYRDRAEKAEQVLKTIRPFLIPGDHKEGHLREVVENALSLTSQDRGTQ